MTQPTIIPKPRKRKRQPTAEMMREQLRLAADRIIELETVIDTTKRLMGWDRPAPLPPEPPRERDVTGRDYRTPWYRRLFARTPK